MLPINYYPKKPVCDLAIGSYLTGFRMHGQRFYGAIYDRSLSIAMPSLRNCQNAAYRHADPVYLLHEEVGAELTTHSRCYYLGHYFSHYGHFLLETLPMLHAILHDKEARGVFLPFGQHRRCLLDSFLEVMKIEPDQIIVYDGMNILKADFQVIPRPIAPNLNLYSTEPYHNVVNMIKRSISIASEHSLNCNNKVFLSRKNSRVGQEFACKAEQLFRNAGYAVLNPAMLSIKDQLRVLFEAESVAGFSGSQMHNTMFCDESASVIILGDCRDRDEPHANQRICGEISGSQTAFIPYLENEQETLDLIDAALLA